MLVISWFLCGVLYAVFYCYIFSKVICHEQFILDKKVVCGSVIFALLYFIIMYSNSGVIRPYLTNSGLMILLWMIYRKKVSKTIIGTFLIFLVVCLSELIYDFVMVLFLHQDLIEILKNPIIFIFSNMWILLMASLIFNLKKIVIFVFNLVSWYNENETTSSIIFVILAMIIGIFMMYNNFVNLLPSSFLILTNIFCLCVLGFVIGFFKEKSDKNHIKHDYDHMMSYVKVYENEVNQKNKAQHEYKNQMIVIREMIKQKDPNIIDYINKKIDSENEEENEEWFNKLKYVPLGGLKGLVHYKIQEMLKEDIQIFVDVSPQLEKYEKNKNLNKKLEDISKIIGVYLDNAIEAVKNLKEKYIIIEFYIEDKNIVFSLSNNYEGTIDLTKIEKETYTTKGKGHGYGLSLVKDILSQNDGLSEKKELNGIYFVQKLYIKRS